VLRAATPIDAVARAQRVEVVGRACVLAARQEQRVDDGVELDRRRLRRGQARELGVGEADVERRIVNDERTASPMKARSSGTISANSGLSARKPSDRPCTAKASGCTARCGLM
jgi:hypothetical protein